MASARCFVFDFGNVIAFFDHRKAARQLAALGRPFGSRRSLRAGRRLDAQEVYSAVFQTRLEDDYDSGRVTTAAFIERLRAELDLQASDAEIARAWNDMYTPNTVMLDAIDRIDRRGARLVLGSNTNELHYQWLRPLFAPTLDRFDEEVLSYRIGCRKPDRRFFHACVRACSPVSVADCLYIDDRADFIEAAKDIGIRGIVYRPGLEQTIVKS